MKSNVGINNCIGNTDGINSSPDKSKMDSLAKIIKNTISPTDITKTNRKAFFSVL